MNRELNYGAKIERCDLSDLLGMFLKRRKWTVLLIAIVLLSLSFNIIFIFDLTLNRDAHSHLVDVLSRDEDIGAGGVPPDGDVGLGGGGGARGGKGGEHSVKQFMNVKVKSSKEEVKVYAKNELVYSSSSSDQRGIHVAVLNQATGGLMASRVFDTYMPGSVEPLISFINSLSDGRILCLAIMDEGTFSLSEDGKSALKALGSRLSTSLSWRDMWALVTVKGGAPVGEDVGRSHDLQSWGLPVEIHVTVPLQDSLVECDWPRTKENELRREFCSKYEGYGALCHCAKPLPLSVKSPSLSPNNVVNVPVTIIASNRPLYLFRMIRGLLSAHGANSSLVTVFVDGFFQEPVDVAALFGIRAVQHAPQSQKNGRISQHYKASLTQTFDLYPSAEYTIVIEEDLDVSIDFFSYFSQTVHLMARDDSVYCISAWNDQGYDHSCQDPSLLYRIETMPGLGWLLKRQLFKEELEPNWPSPDKLWDWDMWMRLDVIRKGRECIIPDVSRTYHFGASGLNMNPYFQEHYFKKHTLNKVPNVQLRDVDSLRKEKYELVIHGLFREANILDHKKDPCDKDFIPDTKGKVYVMYIGMEEVHDYKHWMKLATCFHLWDLDARGFHKGLWRFWLKGNQILVVGHPYSPYSTKYKPQGVSPLQLASDEPPKKDQR